MGNSVSQSFDPHHFDGLDYTNVRFFSLNGHKCYGKVVRVTDGDSIWVVIDFPEVSDGELHPTMFKCNLHNYDVPELNDTDSERREIAKRCRELLEGEINGKDVWLEFHESTAFEKQSVDVFLLDEIGEPTLESVNAKLRS